MLKHVDPSGTKLKSSVVQLKWNQNCCNTTNKGSFRAILCCSMLLLYRFFRNNYHLVMTNNSYGTSPFFIGKPSISMGHLYHGEAAKHPDVHDNQHSGPGIHSATALLDHSVSFICQGPQKIYTSYIHVHIETEVEDSNTMNVLCIYVRSLFHLLGHSYSPLRLLATIRYKSSLQSI